MSFTSIYKKFTYLLTTVSTTDIGRREENKSKRYQCRFKFYTHVNTCSHLCMTDSEIKGGSDRRHGIPLESESLRFKRERRSLWVIG